MESITINQKKMACDVFMAFSAGREMHGRLVQACVSKDEFIWEIHPYGYYSADANSDPNPYPEKRVEYRFSRDHVMFRSSSMRDIDKEVLRHWDAFVRREAEMHIKPIEGAMLFNNFYPMSDIPDLNPKEEETSFDVLIDIDGWRKYFYIGCYHTDFKEWRLKKEDTDDTEIDLEHARWTYLPLAARDKK